MTERDCEDTARIEPALSSQPLNHATVTDQRYLRPTEFLDYEHARVRALVVQAGAAEPGPALERGVRLYYAVRDGLRYDPYSVGLDPDGMRASVVLERNRGYCVSKAVVLAAAARSIGIPARLGFADVRNHLATPRLREMMGTDVFYYHGYTELFLEGAWMKATPAFNIELCEKFGVKPLEFDGRGDSIFHPFDSAGRLHMEYVLDRGHRDDVPLEELREAMFRYYPKMTGGIEGDFHEEAGKR